MKVPSMKIGNGVASFRPLSLSCAGSISEQSSRASQALQRHRGRRPISRYSAPERLAGRAYAISTLRAASVRIDSTAFVDSPKHAPLSIRRSSALHCLLINPRSE
jgi:hypothetical protein